MMKSPQFVEVYSMIYTVVRLPNNAFLRTQFHYKVMYDNICNFIAILSISEVGDKVNKTVYGTFSHKCVPSSQVFEYLVPSGGPCLESVTLLEDVRH